MKKAISLLLALTLLLALAACSGDASEGTAAPETTETEAPAAPADTAEVPEEAPADEAPAADEPAAEAPAAGEAADEAPAEEPAAEAPAATQLALGGTASLEGVTADLAITEFQHGETLGSGISVSSHNENNEYFWLAGTLTNTGTETLSGFSIDAMVTIVFDDTYTYEGEFLMMDDIGPFAAADVYFWADVPPAMLENYGTVKVQFAYNDGFAEYDWAANDYERTLDGYDHVCEMQ